MGWNEFKCNVNEFGEWIDETIITCDSSLYSRNICTDEQMAIISIDAFYNLSLNQIIVFQTLDAFFLRLNCGWVLKSSLVELIEAFFTRKKSNLKDFN